MPQEMTRFMENYMASQETKTQSIIQQLKSMDIDGETMQCILKETGMEWQMLRQLVLTMPIEQVEYLMEERKELF